MKIIISAEEAAKKLIERLEGLFATHKDVKEYHVTADHQVFEEKNHADFHAGKLLDKGVATVNRTDVTVAKIDTVKPDPSLLHPEATLPTAEEIAAKVAADKAANDALKTAIAGAPAAPAEPAGLNADEKKAAAIAKGIATKAANAAAKAAEATNAVANTTEQPEAGTEQKAN